MGFSRVRFYVQSGNVVFNSEYADVHVLAEMIESAILQSFGYDVTVFVRDESGLERLIDTNPFIRTWGENSARLYVTFLHTRAQSRELSLLTVPDREPAEFCMGEEEIFLYCPHGYGKT